MEHTNDMDVAGAAVAAPTPPTPEASAPPAEAGVSDAAQASDALALQIEALLITSGRAVTVQRLGEALGLIPKADADAPPPAEPNAPADASSDAAPDGQPAIVTRVKRRSKRHAADAGPAPATPQQRIEAAIQSLNTVYAQSGRSFRIEPMAGGYRFMTLPKFGAVVAALHGATAGAKLSRAAVETLAIIAYKQPITRGKLEAVRGCACGEVLRTLTERRLVTIAGRAEELGRPLLYATSRQFLDAFGLSSLKDLPTGAELK